MASLQIHQFPCLSDNYCFAIHDPESGETAVIDTPEVAPIEAALAEKGWTLTHIFNTHWHPDHAGGNEELKQKTGCRIIGPRAEAQHIPSIDDAVGEGDIVTLGGHRARVFDVPGHTAGHIVYWFEDDGVAFVGDTLFTLGCGRVFEGTFEQMWNSLEKLRVLPEATVVYCAHEYTEANAAFALSVEPDNAELVARAKRIKEMRSRGEATVPTTIGEELRTNPFLRPDSADLQRTLGMSGGAPVDVFAETRRRKDSF